MNDTQSRKTSLLLVKNTVLNLAGYGAPLIVAAFSIPLIIKGIGTDRFGILTLAWVIIGYLSLLDMGIGRALTKVVSEKIGKGQLQDIPSTIWTAMTAMVLLSIVIGLLFGIFSHKIAYELLKIPLELKQETQTAFITLAAVLPVTIISVGFRGVLEAHQRFDLVNAVRIPLGIFSFVAPLAVIPFSAKLTAIIGVLIAGRVAAALVQFYFCYRVETRLLRDFRIDPKIFGQLLRFGGWMTASNVISPILVYLDRFVIGAMLSVSAVAYYATPSEVITKIVLISAALMSVLFPAISAIFHIDRQKSAFLLERGLKYVFICIFPIVLSIISFTPEALAFWLNETFMIQSMRVTQILSVGILFTCLGTIPFAFIQGAGRPDMTGILHMLQLPFYLFFVISAIKLWGINGVAIVWALRAILNAGCMFFLAQRLLGPHRLSISIKLLGVGGALTVLSAMAMVEPIAYRVVSYGIVLSFFIWITFRFLLSKEEITIFFPNKDSGD